MQANGSLNRRLPPPLEDLADLAFDLRWTSSLLTRDVWRRLDPEAWERTENPYFILLSVPQQRLEEAAKDRELLAEVATMRRKFTEYATSPTWFGRQYPGGRLRAVAYFSMEFGLSEALPIYSGGLGMLAGDHLKSASDLGVPVMGVGILYQQGYFRQVLSEDGTQLAAFPYNDPGSLPVQPVVGADGHWLQIPLELPGRTLLLRVWQAKVGRVTLYLLDSNDPLNSPWDRGITASLYPTAKDTRLLQQIVLGVGGWRLLDELGLDAQVCHLNEGHAAFVVLARALSFARQARVRLPVAFWATRVGNVFTTHTPVAAAFDEYDPALLTKYAKPFVENLGWPMENLLALGRKDRGNAAEPFKMAYLAIRGCGWVNGVSRLHGQVSRRLFGELFPRWPLAEVPVGHITNGVHVPTWSSRAARELWLGGNGKSAWLDDLGEAVKNIERVGADELWRFRTEARQKLVEYVRRRLERQLEVRGAPAAVVRQARRALDPNLLTLGFARRFTEYKRPNLLLHDPERLKRLLLRSTHPVQLIVAGKAHPNDDQGKQLVKTMATFSSLPELQGRLVFLEDFDMALAQHLVEGVDVWLNMPRRPAEACGTSGMKVLFNGGLNLSVLDGWWAEAFAPEVGWAVGDDREHNGDGDASEACQLYDLLEHHVIPEFYARDADGIPHSWVERVRASMVRLTPQFSSDRMVKEYVEQVYLPAASAYLSRRSNRAAVARRLLNWHTDLEKDWGEVRFGDMTVQQAGPHWQFEVQVYFGKVPPVAVRVELYAESLDGGAPTVIEMRCVRSGVGTVNGCVFQALAPRDRPAEYYTPRIAAYAPDVRMPLEDRHVLWSELG